MSRIRVLLVDDHAVVRMGYRVLLRDAPEIEIVEEADSGEAACQRFRECAPDVVVMDLSLPGMGGLETIRRIIARDNGACILVFSMHDDAAFVEQALQAGAKGYITKNSAPEMLVEAVQAVASGGTYLDRRLAHAVGAQRSAGESSRLASLSPREFEVFWMLSEGSGIAEIAERLHLSHKTVANYSTAIKSKLGVQNRSELVHFALRHGVLKPDPREP